MLPMKILLGKLIFFIVFKHGSSRSEENDEYPNIQELFVMPTVDTRLTLNTQPNIAAQVTIDIEKLDVDKLRRKLDKIAPSEMSRKVRAFRNFYRLYNATGNETVPLNETRRFKIEHSWGWWLPLANLFAKAYYQRGSRIAQSTKLMDMCLQTIYMARHKIMLLEKEKHFNRKDTGYRIAFIYKNLRRLYRRFVDIYKSFVPRYKQGYYKAWAYWDYTAYYHQRIVRLYIDFLYYYWVMIEIDKEYRERTNWKEPKSPDLEDINPTTSMMKEYFKSNLVFWMMFGK